MLPNSPTSTNRPRHATCRSLPETHSNRSLSQADRNQPVLRSVKIILVSPKIPENIGATLRAASNFEAGRVCVVDPRCDPYSDIISVVACNSPLLHSIQVVPSLRDALAESQGVCDSALGLSFFSFIFRRHHPPCRIVSVIY